MLSILHAALDATERILSDEHPNIDAPPLVHQRHAPVVLAAAHLVARRCAELRELLDFYDAAVDQVIELPHDLPF